MIGMLALVLLAFLQVPSLAEPMRSGCSPDDPLTATLSGNDQVAVEAARAGESDKTCYRVVLTRSGQSSTGYVLGESLPQIAEFVRRRERESEKAAKAQARMALVPPVSKGPGADTPKSTNPFIDTKFEDFSGQEPNGKSINLSSLNGRAVIITFWSPKNHPSQDKLMQMMPLYSQFHKQGLSAVGVSMDPNPHHITAALDDITPGWPQIADQSGLAARYHVDPRAGETFVLDASHRVVAAGPMGPEIEKAVRQLLAAP
jgi:peroxiredoxin